MSEQRLAQLRPAELPAGAKAVYDDIVATRGMLPGIAGDDGALLGPFGVLLYSPEIGDAVQRVGTALRQHADLPRAAVETAILVVARQWHAGYEWQAHAEAARTSGALDDATVELLRRGEPVTSPPSAAVAAAVAERLVSEHQLDDETYEAALREFGDRGVVDLVLLVGYYGLVAAVLRGFAIPARDGSDPFAE